MGRGTGIGQSLLLLLLQTPPFLTEGPAHGLRFREQHQSLRPETLSAQSDIPAGRSDQVRQ